VTFEIIVLALASAIRPTSLAAIYALLAHSRRKVLLIAYLIVGIVCTIAFGLIVVYAFHGIHPHFGRDKTKGIADIIGGTVALLFGLAVLTHLLGTGRGHDAPAPRVHLEGHLTLRTAALAGPATHLPGIFYLIALNVIVAHNLHVAGGMVAVSIYNLVWYALPIIALCLCIVRPATALATVEGVQHFTRRHSRAIVLTVSFGVGAALLIHGLILVL
jgi:Sap, sulfolipid-1-addressing protein